MDSNPSQSRPASVDSVHLGSTYSGYFPSHNLHHHQNVHLPQQNIPQQQLYSTAFNAYQTQYQPQMYPQQQQYPVQHQYPPAAYGASNGVVNATGQANAPLSYPYSMQHVNASATAAARAALNLRYQPQPQQQQQLNQNQQQQQHPNASPLWQQRRQFQPTAIDPTLTQPPAALSNAWLQSYATSPQTFANAASPQQQNNYYTKEYLQQYYNEYYRQLIAYQQQAHAKPKTPLKYVGKHALRAFSAPDNRLLAISANAQIALYNLQEIFIEQFYPHLETLLRHVGTDNAGGDNSESTKTLLPFNDVQVALNWIGIKLLDPSTNYELKLILKVVTMLFRRNGVVSGLELSELLFETITNGASRNEPADSSVADKLSQAGSDRMSQSKEQLLSHLRQLLMHGHPRQAITYAQNNGLFDHAIALAYLVSFQSASGTTTSSPLSDNSLTITTIRKFINTTLHPTDPLFVFYSHLLQIATNFANLNRDASTAPIASTGTARIDSLESFIILVANDIKFERVEIVDNSQRNLIDLMVALLKNDHDYVLPDELFRESDKSVSLYKFNCLLVNECLEYARFRGCRLNPRLLLRKLEFAFELFEFGFVKNALAYCAQIRLKLQDKDLKLKELQENTAQMQESRFARFLLPLDRLTGTEEENRDFVQNLWLYQMRKMITRFDTTETFDSPLILVPEEEEKEEEIDEESEANDNTGIDDEEEESELTSSLIEEPESPKAEIPKAKIVSTNKSGLKPVSKPTNVQSKIASPVPPKISEEKPIENTILDQVQNQSINNEDSFNAGTTNPLSSTMLNSDLSGQLGRLSLTTQVGQDTLPYLNNSSNLGINQQGLKESLAMSPIEPKTNIGSNKFPLANMSQPQFGAPLRESRITPTLNDIPNQTLPKQPPTQPELNLPPPNQPNFNAFPLANAPNDLYGPSSRALNPIRESTLEHSDSLDSSQNASQPQSPAKMPSSFDYNPSPVTFTPSLPNSGGPPVANQAPESDSLQRSSLTNNNHSNNYPQTAPSFFAPPIPSFETSAPVFDFMSTGQVTSIPTLDPFSLNEPAPNSNNHQNNNEQQQQQNLSAQAKGTANKQDTNQKESPSKKKSWLPKWLGGANSDQAILPDDSNPAIVYDPVQKRWVDKSAGDEGANSGPPPAPPKMSLNGNGALPMGGGGSSSQSAPNSTLTSPQNNFSSSPSFPSGFEPPNLASPSSFGPVSNGAVPSSLPSLPSAVPPPGGNQFRGSLRKNRYLDAWNAPSGSGMSSKQ